GARSGARKRVNTRRVAAAGSAGWQLLDRPGGSCWISWVAAAGTARWAFVTWCAPSGQGLGQLPGLTQIAGVGALGEPGVPRLKAIAGLCAPAVLEAQPAEARRRPDLQGPGLLVGHVDGTGARHGDLRPQHRLRLTLEPNFFGAGPAPE